MDTTKIAEAVKALKEIEKQIQTAEETLFTYKTARRCISEVTLPELLTEAGVTKVTLHDGTTVAVTQFCSARITEDKRAEALEYLESLGCGALIKKDLHISLPRDTDDTVIDTFLEMGEASEARVTLKEGVHPKTLEAFIKERLAKGEETNLDLFDAYVGQTAKITY